MSGTIPSEIGQLSNLESLTITYDGISGTIPTEFGQLDFNLGVLDLRKNYLSGPIPSEIGQMDLGVLYLDGNWLTGTIPPELGQLTRMRSLYLADNLLTGTIPAALTQMTNLNYLLLDNNDLTGQVPSGFCSAPFPIWGTTTRPYGPTYKLRADCVSVCEVQCDCCDNCLDAGAPTCPTTSSNGPTSLGSIADCQGAGSATDIVTCLSGPDLLSDPASPQSQALEWILDSTEVNNWDGLEVSQRYAVAVIWASSDDNLSSFGNQNSVICGASGISCNIGNEITNWSEAQGTGGTLPPEIGLLTQLTRLSASYSTLTGELPSEIGLLTQLTRLFLEGNSFTGQIPSEIGQLLALKELYLNANQFSGMIPSELGQLIALGGLFLDTNQLTGTIPDQLTQLTNLVAVTLSNNLLTGEVPFCGPTFPDWRADGLYGQDLWADCIDEVQCDCCDICFDSGGTQYCWDGSGFDPLCL